MAEKNGILALRTTIRKDADLFRRGILSDEEIFAVIEGHGLSEIGHGRECVVVKNSSASNKEEGDTVVALDYRLISPKTAKLLFYSHRIFSNLFPHNFPRFQMVCGGEPDTIHTSGSVRKEVVDVESGEWRKMNSKAKYPFSDVVDVLKDLKIPLCFDCYDGNFGIGVDGGMYYLDRVLLFNDKNWALEKILKYMRENNYSDLSIRIVEGSIKRIRELNSVEEKS